MMAVAILKMGHKDTFGLLRETTSQYNNAVAPISRALRYKLVFAIFAESEVLWYW